jgi:hypothetical protein
LVAAEPQRQDRHAELQHWEQRLDQRQRELERESQALAEDRVIWYERRQEIEREIQEGREALQKEIARLATARPATRDPAVVKARPAARTTGTEKPDELSEREQELAARQEQLLREQQELSAVRQEFAEIRHQLYDRYRERRDRLAGLQAAVSHAAAKVQEEKRQLQTEISEYATRQAVLEQWAMDLKGREDEVAQIGQELYEREQALQTEVTEQQGALEAREQALQRDSQTLRQNQAQYQADLVRLERRLAECEQQQMLLDERHRQNETRSRELGQSSEELQQQVAEVESWKEKVRVESESLDRRREELTADAASLAQRNAALEEQQTALASLRTRLERSREELRREQQASVEQRARLDMLEAELAQKSADLNALRSQLEAETQSQEEVRRQLAVDRSELEVATDQLRLSDARLTERASDLDRQAAEIAERADLYQREVERLKTESTQVAELQKRIATDRESIREREIVLLQAEQSRQLLQEQLRRRSEELSTSERNLAQERQRLSDRATEIKAERAQLEQERRELEQRLAEANDRLQERARGLDNSWDSIRAADAQRLKKEDRLKQTGRKLGLARKQFRAGQVQWQCEQRDAAVRLAEEEARLSADRQQLSSLAQQLPDLELRAQAALERLAQSRQDLRDHLVALHSYAEQSHEDIEAMRSQVLLEAEQVQQQRVALHRAREEHRLAVAAFRQQLIEWQGQVADMKRTLAHGEVRLERRQAQVNEEARRIDATSHRLAEQADQLQEQERIVAENRREMEKHLDDMREWYRRKLRELSQRRRGDAKERSGQSHPEARTPSLQTEVILAHDPEAAPPSATDTNATVLHFNADVDPDDQRLGELLHSLALVEPDTLHHLLREANGSHRSLRQALLSGGYLTVYQMALIETGNVDALVLGPVRVIDRLRVTPREAVYRVFDPRHDREALLRHLAEAEMDSPVHPDEFRQRFRQAAAVKHPNLIEILDVMDIAERPAVVLEWLGGLPANDWPALVAAPGVWLRLVHQAALGLHAVHGVGVVHCHLRPESFLLTVDGILKISGLGEPDWLVIPAVSPQDKPGPAIDTARLCAVAASWAGPASRKRGPRSRIDDAYYRILQRLTAESPEDRYPDLAAMLEDLERAKAKTPPNDETWTRLLRIVRDYSPAGVDRKQSA